MGDNIFHHGVDFIFSHGLDFVPSFVARSAVVFYNNMCLITLVSKNNDHVVLSSEKISFEVDDTSFQNGMLILA